MPTNNLFKCIIVQLAKAIHRKMICDHQKVILKELLQDNTQLAQGPVGKKDTFSLETANQALFEGSCNPEREGVNAWKLGKQLA